LVSEALAERLRVRGRRDKPWLKTFGKLRSLRKETAHISRIVEEELAGSNLRIGSDPGHERVIPIPGNDL